MKGKAYIIHGCPSNAEKSMDPETRTYDKHWIPWTKKELVKHGVEAETPLMPAPWSPDYEAFKAEFSKNAISENDILVGHSCGTAFLVRWLGDTKQKIAKLILVAPWMIPEKKGPTKTKFYEYPIDVSIAERVKEIVYFTSENEDAIGYKSLHIIHEKLGGKIVSLKEHGHYVQGDMGTEEFPELITEILNTRD